MKTIPRGVKERRILIATYHGRYADYPVEHPLWLYGSLGWITRRCWQLGRERGYQRGQLSFKIKNA
ncbi:MAG: hypothetical protein ABSE16_19105 [Verrucomicrobiota bacterium]